MNLFIANALLIEVNSSFLTSFHFEVRQNYETLNCEYYIVGTVDLLYHAIITNRLAVN